VQYEIEIGGRLRRAIVHRTNGTFTVDIDGRQWTVDAQRLDGQSMSLLIGERVRPKGDTSAVGFGPGSAAVGGGTFSHEVFITPDGSGQLAVSVGTRSLNVSLNGRRRGERRRDGVHASGGVRRIVAPMPGKIVRVLVRQGDTVHARQPVVVIEAMKMENELRAGQDGVIAEIHAREGQSVEASQLLAVVSAELK
jgi:biotin carboxyl carrier protein